MWTALPKPLQKAHNFEDLHSAKTHILGKPHRHKRCEVWTLTPQALLKNGPTSQAILVIACSTTALRWWPTSHLCGKLYCKWTSAILAYNRTHKVPLCEKLLWKELCKETNFRQTMDSPWRKWQDETLLVKQPWKWQLPYTVLTATAKQLKVDGAPGNKESMKESEECRDIVRPAVMAVCCPAPPTALCLRLIPARAVQLLEKHFFAVRFTTAPVGLYFWDILLLSLICTIIRIKSLSKAIGASYH